MRPVAAEASPRASEVKDCPILSEMARDGAGVFSSGMLHRNRERNHLRFYSVSSPKSFTVCKYNIFSVPGRTKVVHSDWHPETARPGQRAINRLRLTAQGTEFTDIRQKH